MGYRLVVMLFLLGFLVLNNLAIASGAKGRRFDPCRGYQ